MFILALVINNNGIGAGNPRDFQSRRDGSVLMSTKERIRDYSVKALLPRARYERIADAFGGTGVFVDDAASLENAFARAVSFRPFKPTIINCMISTTAGRGKKPTATPWGGKL